MSKTLIVTEDQAGKRADIVVTTYLSGYSRSTVAILFDNEKVILDGVALKAKYKLRINDEVTIDTDILTQTPDNITLEVIYEDDDVLVVNKPDGVLSHSKGSFNSEGTVSSFVVDHVGIEEPTNRQGIVHRLDRATSGVMICAKNDAASAWLQQQFSERKVKKTYIAVVNGSFEDEKFTIDVPLERNPNKPQTFMASIRGKQALTDVKVLNFDGDNSILRLSPHTGRTHQLRVHLAYMKHPIIGDYLYDGKSASRLMLHAYSLEIILPSKVVKKFICPVPDNFYKNGVVQELCKTI